MNVESSVSRRADLKCFFRLSYQDRITWRIQSREKVLVQCSSRFLSNWLNLFAQWSLDYLNKWLVGYVPDLNEKRAVKYADGKANKEQNHFSYLANPCFLGICWQFENFILWKISKRLDECRKSVTAHRLVSNQHNAKVSTAEKQFDHPAVEDELS